MTTLGIDASTVNLGLCWLTDGTVSEFDTITLPGDLHGRLFHAGQIMCSFMVRPDITDVAIEDCYVGPNVRTTKALAMMLGAIISVCPPHITAHVVNRNQALSVVGLTPSKWMKRERIKAETVRLVGMICEAEGTPLPQDEHQADAYLLAAWVNANKRE